MSKKRLARSFALLAALPLMLQASVGWTANPEDLWWAVSMRVVHHETVFQNVSYGAAWQFTERNLAEKAAYKECKKTPGRGDCEKPGEMRSEQFYYYVEYEACTIVGYDNTVYGRHYYITFGRPDEATRNAEIIMCPE